MRGHVFIGCRVEYDLGLILPEDRLHALLVADIANKYHNAALGIPVTQLTLDLMQETRPDLSASGFEA